MKKYLNEDIIKIILSIILLSISFLFTKTPKLVLLVLSYIVISYEMYMEAFKDLLNGEIFNEEFLMIIATLGAFYIGSSIEAVLVILLFSIGEYLEHQAVNNSRESITKLMDLRVDKINIIKDNKTKTIKVEKANIGDIFIVKPGERIPLDGKVIEGETYLDTSSLTGESVPRKVIVNDNILSGGINREGLIKVEATSTSSNSTVQKIIDLIEKSEDSKSNTESFIRKFSKIYTPSIVLSAILLVLIPTILGLDFNEWLYKALVFLVTSCPCALVLSVPLGFYSGIGALSKRGILVKGSRELEKISDIDYILLDKTGTITEGVFEVTKVNSKINEKEFIKVMASSEQNSTHPIANAILDFNKEKLIDAKYMSEISGHGISCKVNNKSVLVGNDKLMKQNNIKYDDVKTIGTIVHMAIDNKYVGYLVVSDRIKESSKKLSELKKLINKEIIVLSGDKKEAVESVSIEVKADKSYSELLPQDKVKYVTEYKEKGKVMFIGDGINDAPVIKIADVGVSMGGIGSDAAIEASDIVLMHDDLSKLIDAIKISRTTKFKVRNSIIFALLVKLIVLILGVLGISTIVMAVFADVGVTLLVILYVLTIFKNN